MIIETQSYIWCPHCGINARVKRLSGHGATMYEVECEFCGNKSTAHRMSHHAVQEYNKLTPHYHIIGMGYFLNEKEGAAYVYRPVTLSNHRDCMEIISHGGYEEMLLRHNFCPECGCDVRPFVSAMKTFYEANPNGND